MSRSNAAATTRRDDDDSSLSIARALSLSWNVRFKQGGTRGSEGGNGPSFESDETSGSMSRSSTAAATTRRDDDGSSLSIARALWTLAKWGTERGMVHSSTVNE
ncbi:hypothetical protein BHM03_00017496 [Ensete ventricosum]|nr:hypothetical protein BHM03_00017496 [Ensete ventricosum]